MLRFFLMMCLAMIVLAATMFFVLLMLVAMHSLVHILVVVSIFFLTRSHLNDEVWVGPQGEFLETHVDVRI